MNDTAITVANENAPQLNHMKNNKLDDSLFSKDLAPHYMQLAGKLATSELVPKSFRGKPQDLFLCWAIGYSIGMSPEQAMQCIAIINGRACMWGDEMLALCMAHKDFVDIIETAIYNDDSSVFGYTCTVKRKNKTDRSNTFTLEDAKKAGLLAKGGVWSQYPSRMLKLRARAFTLRDACPDILKGIHSREEVEDYIDADYTLKQDKSKSRVEILKEDYLIKTGKINNVENDISMDVSEKNNETSKKTSDDIGLCSVEQNLEEVVDLREQVKRFAEETGLSDERLAKALEYYEVNTIDDLSDEAAQDFITQLTRR